jgi:hypothetical protein
MNAALLGEPDNWSARPHLSEQHPRHFVSSTNTQKSYSQITACRDAGSSPS